MLGRSHIELKQLEQEEERLRQTVRQPDFLNHSSFVTKVENSSNRSSANTTNNSSDSLLSFISV